MTYDWHPAGVAAHLACPVCAAPPPHPVVLRSGGYTLARCGDCRTCFFTDRATRDYEEEAGSALYQQLYLEQNAGIHHMTRFLYAIDDDGIDSVLDVGCGFGYPVDVAAKVLGWRAVGIDPSPYARGGAALLKADIRKDYLTDRTELGEPFSLVHASEVIEHIGEPYAFLPVLRRWLKPGGTLILTTPDADAVHPGTGPASLVCILSLGGHLILYSTESLALMLRRAGFAHVRVESAQDNLIAYASGQPLRMRDPADAAARHVKGYQAYLNHLANTAEPGTPLWNGGAGRLFVLEAGSQGLEGLYHLWGRIAAAWKDRYGFDLSRPQVPPGLAERDFTGQPTLVEHLAARQPLNLPVVLFSRALLEHRTPGRSPLRVLDYARPAYAACVQVARALLDVNLIDLHMRDTAWQARLLVLDCLAEMAPEMEGELLASFAQPSPGALHHRIDPPPQAVANRIAPYVTACVRDGRLDEAARLAPFLRDLDLLCAATAAMPERMGEALLALGTLHRAQGRAEDARAALDRLAEEAVARQDTMPAAARLLDQAYAQIRAMALEAQASA